MLTHLINAWKPDKKHSTNKNLLFNIIPQIVNNQQTQRYISIIGIKKRLTIAVEYLHHPTVEKRLEGILELENLAQAHTQYHWEIMEILADFVRINAPHKNYNDVNNMASGAIQPDIEACLNAIAKRNNQQDLESELIDLSYTDLRGMNLSEANLAGANLYQVNLSGANLAGANLAGAILSAANLSGANLCSVNFSGAILSAANLSGANLTKANLTRANLYLANLCQANLQEAIVDGANLREVKLSGQETVNAE